MTRFHLALMFVLALTVVACTTLPPTITPPSAGGGAGTGASTGPSTGATADPSAEALQIKMMNSQLAVGMERLAFQVQDAKGNAIPSAATVDVAVSRVEDIAKGQMLQMPSASGKAVRFGDDMPGGGAWVVYHDFDSSGPWSVDITVTFPDAHHGTGRARFTIQGRTQTLRVGDRPTMLDTPKLGAGTALASLTSDHAPVEALYRQSVADAIASNKPSVVFFGAPASCTACAATLEEVKAVLAATGSEVNFIHVESADPAKPGQPSAAAQAWGVPPDVPWTFILDRQGFVMARVEGALSRTELDLLVKRALGQQGA